MEIQPRGPLNADGRPRSSPPTLISWRAALAAPPRFVRAPLPRKRIQRMKHILKLIAWHRCRCASTAHAHVVPTNARHWRAVTTAAHFRVGHGCDVVSATVAVTVRIPDGMRGAKPMPKSGLTIERRVETGAAVRPHGKKVTEDVVAITWRRLRCQMRF